MQSFDDKVDDAVHAAFMALGLSVGPHMELAYRLNDFITQEFGFLVTDDEDEPDDEIVTVQQPDGAASTSAGEGSADD